jgi:hypothetical protein
MDEQNQTNEFDDLPKCHYCDRYAFEITFQGIHICDKCLDHMTKGRLWRVMRDVDGHVWITLSDAPVSTFEILGEGTFIEMWNLSHKDDPNYG